MNNLPDLTDPDVAKHSLLIGFSYSLTPDGGPGSYNEKIAQSIRTDLQKAVGSKGALPWTGMQWEIYDAIVEHDESDSFKAGPLISRERIAAPPMFEPHEFNDPTAFVNLLKSEATKAVRELKQQILDQLQILEYLDLDDAMLDQRKLALYLNRILDDRNSFHRYEGTLEFHNLHRIQLGSLGTEKRVLPQSADYPHGLREFQARRVNRLIIEAICPAQSILNRGKYLSTQGILTLLLQQVEQDCREIKYAFVYGHPQHSSRCRRQLLETAWMRGWTLQACDVYDVHEEQNWPWDLTTAQVWCHSLVNWQDYERMGKARLK